MISYYELAGLIKDGTQPLKIKHMGRKYEFENGLYLTDEKTYKVALGGLEGEINIFANIFNKNIEIIEEKPKEIDEWGKVPLEELETKRLSQNELQIFLKTVIYTQNELIRGFNYLLKKEDDK